MRGVWVLGLPLRTTFALAVLLAAGGQGGAQESPSGRLSSLSLSGNEPISIESDRLDVIEAESKAIFLGNVNVVQGPTQLKAGKLTVYYVKNDGGSAATGTSQIDHLEVDEKVYIKSDQQEATGDRGTFDMKTEILILSGKQVVLSEGANVLVGCKLTVNMKTSRAQVEGCQKGEAGSGRVQMSITPGSQSQQNQ